MRDASHLYLDETKMTVGFVALGSRLAEQLAEAVVSLTDQG